MLPSAALHHLLWDYGIVFVFSRTVYTWLDPQRTRYGFGYGAPWSSAGLTHALEEDIVHTARLWGGTCMGA